MRVNDETKSVDMEQRDINYILPAYIISYLFQSKNEDPVKIVFPMYASVPHPRKPGVLIPIEYVASDSSVAVEIAQDGSNIPEATEEEIRQIDEKENIIKEMKEEVTPVPDEPFVFSPEEDFTPDEELPLPEDEGIPPSEEPLSPARAAFAETAGESVHKVEKERYEAKDEEVQAMAEAVAGTEEEPKAELEVVGEAPPALPPPVIDRQPKQPPGGALPPGTPLDDMQSRDTRLDSMVAKDIAPQPDVDEEEEIPTEIEKPKEQ